MSERDVRAIDERKPMFAFVKRLKQFRAVYIVIIFVCFGIFNRAIASNISVEDIIGGI